MKTLHENISIRNSECSRRHRREIEMLKGRLELLTGRDKILMRMYVEHENSIRQIAGLLGVCESTVARRVRRLTKRLLAGRYIESPQARRMFSARQLETAADYFLRGLSIRAIARKRRRSCYYVRSIVTRVQNCSRRIR